MNKTKEQYQTLSDGELTAAVQGLCVYGYDDRIYVTSGAKNDEATLMSVMDFEGNILQKLVKVGVSVDKQQLIKLK